MIYLKKLEVYGFKSFADKLQLTFDQPITGIVGPNGCGKSNVSDAIRWVLGEQSTKMLRGKNMQDLIFAGTDQRKSMSYCEVSLFMDNSTRVFPLEMDEIIISRKLYRNGDSEYLLNRNVVRLRDIQELLRSVGLGKEGYSIVGQGRMDAILNARPVDRRGIFEEALGISRFRLKKVETEKKLEKTKINMDSLNILSKELEGRINPLVKQANNARKFLEFRDQLRYEEINTYIYNYDHASQHKHNSRLKLRGLSEESNIKEARYVEVDALYSQMLQDITNLDSKLADLRQKHVTLAVDIERKSGDKKVIREKFNSCQAEINNNLATIEQYKSDIAELEIKVSEDKTGLDARQKDIEVLNGELSQLNSQFAQLAREVEHVRKSLDNEQARADSLYSSQSAGNITHATLTSEQGQHNARLAQLANHKQELMNKLSALSGTEGALLANYDKAQESKIALSSEIDDLSTAVKQLEFDVFAHNKVVTSASQQLASEKGSIELLSDFANNYKGYYASVASLMQDAKHNNALSSRIEGVVANVIDVAPDYVTAIETALGNRLQNVITANEQDTKYLIQHLKDNKYGRVTFLPIASMKPQTISGEILSETGVVGVAVNLINFDSKYSSVFHSILGGIVIVDNYDNAVALSRKYRYSYRMVTLAGERIATDGSIEGGSSQNGRSSLLTYDSQLSARKGKLAELTEHLRTVEAEHKMLTDKLSADKKQLSKLRELLVSTELEIATGRERIESSNLINNSDKTRLQQIEAERDEILARLDAISGELSQLDIKLNRLALEEIESKANLIKYRELLDTKSQAKDVMAETISSKKYRQATLSSNIDMISKTINGNLVDIVKLESTLKGKLEYIAQLKDAQNILQEALVSDGADMSQQQQLQDVVAQLDSSEQLKTELSDSHTALGDERMQLSVELENIRGIIAREEYILEQIDYDLNELQERVYLEYGVTYSEAMLQKDEEYNNEGGKERITQLKQSMARLGDVNVNAIYELDEVREKFGNIDEQLADMRKADSDLRDILKQLTVEIQTRFEAGMEQINNNFKSCFRELFNGGNARLILDSDESKDILEYGVEIEAQPPGKKLQNISLLSGGERTLTAAAILFAILKLHPMPFCVLDEIEAALDDSNADKIAKYLRKFSESTQFIVITHKKPTMENADVLYGVTMEEKGVSKIVSVKLNEAVATI